MFNKIVELISVSYTQDSIGQQTELKTFRRVYAKLKSVPQSEFFSAGQSSIKPSGVFIVRTAEYKGETKLKYNGLIYSIYRTYNTTNEMTELYCEVRKGEQ